MINGREVRCELTGEHTYDRCVGIRHLDGDDIAVELVRQGVARDCPRDSGGRYAEAERTAVAVSFAPDFIPAIASGHSNSVAEAH